MVGLIALICGPADKSRDRDALAKFCLFHDLSDCASFVFDERLPKWHLHVLAGCGRNLQRHLMRKGPETLRAN